MARKAKQTTTTPALPFEPPAEPLPELRFKSLDDVDRALLELSELARTEANVAAKHEAVVEANRKVCDGKLVVEVDGLQVKIADRKAALEADVKAFCERHRKEILGDTDKKSRDLNHGKIGWQKARDSIEELPAEEGQPQSVWQAFAAKVTKALVKALAGMKLGLGKLTTSVLSVKVSPDKRGVLAHYAKKELTDAQLTKLGLRHVAGADVFYCEPKVAAVESLESIPAAAPAEAA